MYMQVDNTIPLSDLPKMGRTKNPELMQINEIWEFLLGQGIIGSLRTRKIPRNGGNDKYWERNQITFLLQGFQISFQVISLGSRIPTVLAQMLFNRNAFTGVYLHSLYLP